MTTSNPLARLIDETREANGWSDYDIARRAKAAGHQMSKSTISDIRTKGVATIVPDKVRALARGLDLPVSEILRAMLETAGLPVGPASSSPEQAVRADPQMPAVVKSQLLAMIREVRKVQPVQVEVDLLSVERAKRRLERVIQETTSLLGAAESEDAVTEDVVRGVEELAKRARERHTRRLAKPMDGPDEQG